MVLSSVPDLISVFQHPVENNIDDAAANIFELKFKQNFMTWEKNFMNNWRLHDHYIRAVGSVAI